MKSVGNGSSKSHSLECRDGPDMEGSPSLARIRKRVKKFDGVCDKVIDEAEQPLSRYLFNVAVINLRTHDGQSLRVHCFICLEKFKWLDLTLVVRAIHLQNKSVRLSRVEFKILCKLSKYRRMSYIWIFKHTNI